MLDSYTGMHSFTFLLNTNGMRLYNEDGQYYLATSADAFVTVAVQLFLPVFTTIHMSIYNAYNNGSPFCAFCESKLSEIIPADILTTNS